MATEVTILLHWQKFDNGGLMHAGNKVITFSKETLTQAEIETEQATIFTDEVGAGQDTFVIDNITVLARKQIP